MGDNTKYNRQNINSFSKRKLLSLVRNDMGYTDDDFDFKNITKDELLEIVGNTMGSELDFDRGGLATKKYVNPVKIVDNRKKK